MACQQLVRSFATKGKSMVYVPGPVYKPKFKYQKHKLPKIFNICPPVKIRVGVGKWNVLGQPPSTKNKYDRFLPKSRRFSTVYDEQKHPQSNYVIPTIWRSGSYAGEHGEGTIEAFIGPSSDHRTCSVRESTYQSESQTVPQSEQQSKSQTVQQSKDEPQPLEITEWIP